MMQTKNRRLLLSVAILVLAIEVFAEKVGLVGKEYRPILRLISEKNASNQTSDK